MATEEEEEEEAEMGSRAPGEMGSRASRRGGPLPLTVLGGSSSGASSSRRCSLGCEVLGSRRRPGASLRKPADGAWPSVPNCTAPPPKEEEVRVIEPDPSGPD